MNNKVEQESIEFFNNGNRLGLIKYSYEAGQCILSDTEARLIVKDLDVQVPGNLSVACLLGKACDSKELLLRIKKVLEENFTFSDESKSLFLAALILSSYTQDNYLHVPLVTLTGPAGCGKSTVVKLLHSLSYKALLLSGADTESATIRTIGKYSPATVVIDEAQGDASNPQSLLHKLLTLGNEQGKTIQKSFLNKRTNKFEVESINTFGIKVCAGRSAVGDDDAILSRGLTIQLDALTKSEVINRPSRNPSHLSELNELKADLTLFRQRLNVGEIALDAVEEGVFYGFSMRDEDIFYGLIETAPKEYRQQIVNSIYALIQLRKETKILRLDYAVIMAINEALAGKAQSKIKLKDIRDIVTSSGDFKFIDSKKIAHIARDFGFISLRHGTGVVLEVTKKQLEVVIKRHFSDDEAPLDINHPSLVSPPTHSKVDKKDPDDSDDTGEEF